MSEQTAELLLVLVLVPVLVLVLLGLLLLLQPVTSAAVTTHAAVSRLPNALHRTVTPFNRRVGLTTRLTLKHPAG
jgi:hypothetical protein